MLTHLAILTSADKYARLKTTTRTVRRMRHRSLAGQFRASRSSWREAFSDNEFFESKARQRQQPYKQRRSKRADYWGRQVEETKCSRGYRLCQKEAGA